jgi:DNA processing protein
MSWGPNLLIKQGAKLVQDWNDVVVDLPQTAQRRLIDQGRQRILDQGLTAGSGTTGEAAPETSGGKPASEQTDETLNEPHQQVARKVLGRLKTDEAVQLDFLVDTFDEASPSEIIAALFELEILGLVRQLPGRNFVKVW